RPAGRRQHAHQRDLQPGLPGRPGGDHDARLRVHLREPGRRPSLRRHRPEDLAGMSQPDFDAPILAPEGPSEVGTGQWVYVPTRRAGRFAKWKNPIGIAGAIIVGFNLFVALFGKYLWTIDPNELVATRLEGPRWGPPVG